MAGQTSHTSAGETLDGAGGRFVRTRSYDDAGNLLEEVVERDGRLEERIRWTLPSNPSGRPFMPASSGRASPQLPVPVPHYCPPGRGPLRSTDRTGAG